jgi:hypothetical protein
VATLVEEAAARARAEEARVLTGSCIEVGGAPAVIAYSAMVLAHSASPDAIASPSGVRA